MGTNNCKESPLKHLLTFILLLAGKSFGATITAATSSYADVNTAVNTTAARGDTVRIPSGSSTWSSTLTITKGVHLVGGSGGTTTITRSADVAIQISPDATAISNDETIEVSQLTIDGGGASIVMIDINGASAGGTKAFNNLMISSNIFQNGGTTTSGGGIISLTGQARGVIGRNTFNRCNVVGKIMGNDSKTEWTNTHYNNFAYGNSDNLFFEDNTIRYSSSYGGADPGWIEIGQGGRLVIRYNVWSMSNASQTELWDIHGSQNWSGGSGGQTSTMIVEAYGNGCYNATGYRWVNHRGSWGLYFNNLVTGSGGMSLDLYGVTSPGRCDSDVGAVGYTIEVNNTYFWNNSDDGSISSAAINTASCGVTENTDFFNYNASFNGSTGIGRGTSAPGGSATTGVAYWVASTATPTTNSAVIQAGTLYKATAPNTYTAYYTPYTYPHPLLADAGGGGTSGGGGGTASQIHVKRGSTFSRRR
jgi:hypothetical protein